MLAVLATSDVTETEARLASAIEIIRIRVRNGCSLPSAFALERRFTGVQLLEAYMMGLDREGRLGEILGECIGSDFSRFDMAIANISGDLGISSYLIKKFYLARVLSRLSHLMKSITPQAALIHCAKEYRMEAVSFFCGAVTAYAKSTIASGLSVVETGIVICSKFSIAPEDLKNYWFTEEQDHVEALLSKGVDLSRALNIAAWECGLDEAVLTTVYFWAGVSHDFN